MPWGCLCSKEKKRPQISSPILSPEDCQKLQLLPAARRPLLSAAEKLEQRLLPPNPPAGGEFDNESSEETQPPSDAGRDRLQQQLLQKSKLKSSNLKSTTYTRNTENDKLTRHLNTVKFSFDEPHRISSDHQQQQQQVRSDGGAQVKPPDRNEPPPKPDRKTPLATTTTTATAQVIAKPPEATGNVPPAVASDNNLLGPSRDDVDCNGNGNYDVVPSIKISDDSGKDALQPFVSGAPPVDENKNEIIVGASSDSSIPFIDEDPSQILKQLNANPQRGQNFHDARVITLTPKNVGSEATRAASEQANRERMRLLADTKKFTRFLVEPQVETVKFTHIFQILPPAYDRICQQCHQALHLDIGLRCVVCDFTCHQQCVRLEKRKARYTDTSYLIFQQLTKGGVLYAFPQVVGLLQSPKKHASTSSAPSSPKPGDAGEPLVIESPDDAILGKHKKQNGYKAKDTRKSAGSGIPRRQSKIAEKRRNRRSLELKAVEELPREESEETKEHPTGHPPDAVHDETKVQVCDISGRRDVVSSGDTAAERRTLSVISSDEPDSVQQNIQVAVDFHHRPNSEVEPCRGSLAEANNNDLKCKTQNEPARTVDSDVESVSTLTPSVGRGSELPEDRGSVGRPEPVPTTAPRMAVPGVQIRRKQYPYEPCYLVGSELSDTSDFTDTASSVASDLEEVEYARVELRKKNTGDDEQQAINKYNSLPLHAISNGQQQQQQQSPHLQQSRPTTNLNHVNNNHYHNYSLQPHYRTQQHQQQQHQHQLQIQQQQQLQHHSYPASRSVDPPSLRLNYVTERILASTLPARRLQNGSSSPFAAPGGSSSAPADEHERELINMLEQKHKQNYRIFDLESCLANITLEKLCELCKYIDSWLGSGKEKIVVLQDREDKHRLGAAIAAYLQYQKICGSNIPQGGGGQQKSSLSPAGSDSGRKTPTWLDLDIYSTQKFLETVAGPLRIPSHKRYIQYFSGLLSGMIKMNSSSLFLKAIRVESPPCLHYRAITVNSEWRSFIKIFEGVRCLFTSDIYVIPLTTRHFIYEIKHPLRLRGDVLVRCYQIIPNNNKANYEKELIASVQFHTCAITEKEVQFSKGDLDLACDDERFSVEHKMTFCFDTVPNERPMILVFQDPLVRIESLAENGDHLETINEDESNHTQGPLDGSLYATILKSPKSPTAPTHLISPPAEFSNGKPIPNGAPQPPPVPERSKTPNSIYLSHNGTPRTTPVPFSLLAGQPSPGADSSGPVVLGTDSVKVASGSAGGNGGAGGSATPAPGVSRKPTASTAAACQVDGRESVRSPLTVSMDSGISSSGPVNRRAQGCSSVSPSSFPSQASPQDDRHRELDDLLSDMMLTVQGIPDVGRKADQTNHHHHQHQQQQQQQLQQQQQQQQHQLQQNPNDHFVNTNTDTIKRSHSAQLPLGPRDDRSRTPLTVSDFAAAKERELLLYETSSTTTTLTPPPSESGRDTPLLSAYGMTAVRDRELQNINNNNLTPAERELLLNMQRHQQQQSLAYPRPARSTTGASERFTSDDDDDQYGGGGQIPYHAREDSRPFTYGNIPPTGTPQQPPAGTMIKMQSGLSSPSMVRKALGTPTATRKATLPRNDFEEMLRERREKVLSEKYTIGDQSPAASDSLNNNSSSSPHGNWTSYQQRTVQTVSHGGAPTTANGAVYHEPLRRSNTMDGSFGRQLSNEGISGQTWLQLQQHKLQARREQQRREHSNSFSYNYGSPAFPTGENVYSTTHRRSQTLSPVRNERNYHTLTTTTRTHSTERPFVAVQRAHENAKLQTIGNAPLSILNASPHGHIAQARQNPSPSPSAATTTSVVSSPSSPAPGTATHHHQQRTVVVNGTGSPMNGGQAPKTPPQQQHQHRHTNGTNGSPYQQQQQLQQHLNNSTLNGSSGLLSLADQDHSTPKHGQVRLESEQIIFSNINSLNNLDNCEKLNNLLNEITNSAAAVAAVASAPDPAPSSPETGAAPCMRGQPANTSANGSPPSVTTSSSSSASASSTSSSSSSSASSSVATSNHSASLINHAHRPLIDSYHHPEHQPHANHHNHHPHQHQHHQREKHAECPGRPRNGRDHPNHGPVEPEPMDLLSSPDGSVDEKEANGVGGERRNGTVSQGQLALDKLLASLALENDVTEEHLAKIDAGRTNGCYNNADESAHHHHQHHPSRELSDVLANLAEYDMNENQRLTLTNGNLYHYQQMQRHQQHSSMVSMETNGNYRSYAGNGSELANGGQRSASRNSSEAAGPQQQHHGPASMASPHAQHHHQHHPPQTTTTTTTTHHHTLLMNNHVRRIASETDSTISSISPSLSERSNAISWCDQAREESFSSYRSETEPDNSPMGGSPRPETPAFPVTPRTPYGLSNGTSSPALPPKSPTSQRKYNSAWSLRSHKSSVSTYDVSAKNVLLKHLEKLSLAKLSLFQCVAPVLEKRTQGCTFAYDKDLFSGNQQRTQELINQNEALSCYTSRRNSTTSNANSEPQEVAPQFVKFARDSSKYWYKPNISREDAIALLRNAPPGTFIVRDSTTFANAYGLVVKVNQLPPGVQYSGPNGEELVRHFLVEPTIRGVRLKGCVNEPVFTSLSALVYQHSITQLALPCRLLIPDMDLQQMEHQSPAQQQLLQQGAACNVLYLFTCDTESLTGPQAIRKAVSSLLAKKPLPKPTQVHFKASLQGITLTDNTRQLFFRRHYPSNNVSFCALDPDDHRWSIPSTTGDIPASKRIFAFVAKRSPSSTDNQCHVFCELEPTQPAAAIIQFANKVLGGPGTQQPAVTRAI